MSNANPSPNPYQSPEGENEALRKMLASDELVKRGFKIIFCSAAFCGLIGAAVGGGLGAFTPGYYRAVIPGGDRTDFVPWQVGLGLGFTQGLILGLIVGCVVLLSAAWYKSRIRTMVEHQMKERKK